MTNGGAIILRKARNQTKPVMPKAREVVAVVQPTPVYTSNVVQTPRQWLTQPYVMKHDLSVKYITWLQMMEEKRNNDLPRQSPTV